MKNSTLSICRLAGLVALAWLFTLPVPLRAQNVSPFGGIASYQAFDNSGLPATNAVLYFFAAGTSTQQATFSDSAGQNQNVNPLPFGTGARATIWLTTSAFYKVVLCAANDGPFCSAGDVLYSIDNLPGGSAGGGGGGTCTAGCTGFFVSGTASPSTTGTLRVATGDSAPCWRNQAGSANLCLSKDSTDILNWAGGSWKMPEVNSPSPQSTFDILQADNTLHRWKQYNNGAAGDTVVGAATVDTFTNKTFDAQGSGNNFKIGGISISNTGQSSTTFLRGDGA